MFGFVKRNLSGAQRRKDAGSGERGVGKGAPAPVPASAHRELPSQGNHLLIRQPDYNWSMRWLMLYLSMAAILLSQEPAGTIGGTSASLRSSIA